MLCTCRPTLTDTRDDPPAPCPHKHATAVSDAHDPPSLRVPPARGTRLNPPVPSPDPLNVKLTEPVPPPFPRPTLLTNTTSADIPFDSLPARCPAVTTTRSEPCTPAEPLHCTDV